jgi:hypothetical protein
MIKNPLRKYLYNIHIWVGLLTVAFLILYLVSGVLLNHRSYFGPLERWENKTIVFDEQQKAAGHELLAAMKEVNAAMVKYTKNPQFDNIYVGGDGSFTIMDRTGRTPNFHIKASGETGAFTKSIPVQPWNFMNQQMHRNGQMTAAWRGLSTTLCVILFVVLVAGLLILPWNRLEFILLLAGIALLAIGMYVAVLPHGAGAASAAITIPYCPTLGLFS